VPAGILFLLILPFLLIRYSARIDAWLHLPSFYLGVLNIIVGLLLIVGGIYLAFWYIQVQITIGRGTPVPVMPTHKLIVQPPFTYCRNPMTLGTIIAYSGIGVWIGSYSALAIVWAFGFLLLMYIKFIEEKELETRFGAEYVEYKQHTPFILPRLRRRA
jgi:protein-S-isoprenylcysteine O-methyltransferase Ste14